MHRHLSVLQEQVRVEVLLMPQDASPETPARDARDPPPSGYPGPFQAASSTAAPPERRGPLDDLLRSAELSWFLLLLPGFVLVSVMGVVTERPEWSELEFTAFSLIGSALCLGVTLPLFLLVRHVRARRRPEAAVTGASSSPRMLATFYVLNFGVAVVLGGAIGAALEHDASIRAINGVLGSGLDKRSWMRPSKLVLRNNHNAKLIQEGGEGRSAAQGQPRGWVRFTPKDGSSYEGWPLFLPHGNSHTEIYLTPACRKDKGDLDFTPLPGPGVLLPLAEFASIELLDEADNECFTKVQDRASCLACEDCVVSATPPASAASIAGPCADCATQAFHYARSHLIPRVELDRAMATHRACDGIGVCESEPTSAACAKASACVAAASRLARSARCTPAPTGKAASS